MDNGLWGDWRPKSSAPAVSARLPESIRLKRKFEQRINEKQKKKNHPMLQRRDGLYVCCKSDMRGAT